MGVWIRSSGMSSTSPLASTSRILSGEKSPAPWGKSRSHFTIQPSRGVAQQFFLGTVDADKPQVNGSLTKISTGRFSITESRKRFATQPRPNASREIARRHCAPHLAADAAVQH